PDRLPDGTPVASTPRGAGTVTISDAAALVDGPYSHTTRQTDIASNVATSSALIVTMDTTSPATPGAPDLQPASDSGVNNDNITKTTPRLFDISITAEAGTIVEMLRSGAPVHGAPSHGAASLDHLTH